MSSAFVIYEDNIKIKNDLSKELTDFILSLKDDLLEIKSKLGSDRIKSLNRPEVKELFKAMETKGFTLKEGSINPYYLECNIKELGNFTINAAEGGSLILLTHKPTVMIANI